MKAEDLDHPCCECCERECSFGRRYGGMCEKCGDKMLQVHLELSVQDEAE